MDSWAFYPAFIGTLLSITGWGYLVWTEYDSKHTYTLSELAANKKHTLTYFRIVLWVCGVLFTITTLLFIVPRIEYDWLLSIVWVFTLLCEVLVGVFPPKGKRLTRIHTGFANIMVVGMLVTTSIFTMDLQGGYSIAEAAIAILMMVLIVLATINREKFLHYELTYIFLSHISILIAAVGVR